MATTPYLSVDELERYGISAQTLALFSDDQLREAILHASSEADTYLVQKIGVPLVDPPPAVKMHVARMAVYDLLSFRGFVADGEDAIVVANRAAAIAFFRDVAAGKASLGVGQTPPGDTDPSDDMEGALMWSDEPRGYPTDGRI